jgi:hypothetical protein
MKAAIGLMKRAVQCADLSATRSKLRIRISSVIARRDEGAGAAICHIMQLGLYGQISPLRTSFYFIRIRSHCQRSASVEMTESATHLILLYSHSLTLPA